MSYPPAPSQSSEIPPGQPMAAPGSFIADPAPLGLAGFALTTFVLSMANTNILDISGTPVVFGLALAYGGIAQFAAGIWEFTKGNTFGATAFCSYGAFWISYWYLTGHTDLAGMTENTLQNGIGVYLIGWGVFTLYMAVAATRVSLAVLAVFVLLTVTFFILGIANIDGESSGLIKLGGWLGLATAAAAWYASFAAVTNFTYKRTVLPTGPRR